MLGLLGESGFGKSVTLRAPDAAVAEEADADPGQRHVLRRDVLALNDERTVAFRGQTVSMIFQEPALALDPVYTIGAQIAETVMRQRARARRRPARRWKCSKWCASLPERRLDAFRTKCPAACDSAR